MGANKIAIFLIGFLFGCLVTIATSYLTKSDYSSYNYSDEKTRVKLMELLDARGIMYSYKIDHLKRHWITPMVKNDDIVIDLVNEIKK